MDGFTTSSGGFEIYDFDGSATTQTGSEKYW